jgi:hypothetical protein
MGSLHRRARAPVADRLRAQRHERPARDRARHPPAPWAGRARRHRPLPEGTRFSDAKRARILSSLRHTHPEAYARGVRLRHVLPPHPSGLLALLAHAPALDVVFCAHTGLEGASQFRDLLAGSLLGRIVRVQLWRVRRAEIPAERDAQLMWLQDQWERVDRWIGANEVSIMPR